MNHGPKNIPAAQPVAREPVGRAAPRGAALRWHDPPPAPRGTRATVSWPAPTMARLISPPSDARVCECVQGAVEVVDARVVDEHLGEVLKSGTQPGAADGEVDVGGPAFSQLHPDG